ncbi:MAG: hypothetical protein ACOYL5_00430 [Phototrophicaceae bacterium]
MIPVLPHYTHMVKLLIRLYERGALPNVAAISVEPLHGFVARIHYHSGAVRYLHGASVDVNGNGAARIATDKDFAKHFMAELGYRTPHGKAFLTPHHKAELHSYYHNYNLPAPPSFEDVPDYIANTLGFPCFIKPNDGHRGVDVYQCTTMHDVDAALAILATRRLELILVEQAVKLPEYRVVIYNGALMACYGKQALTVTGDGTSTVHDLLAATAQQMAEQGRPLDLAALLPQIQARLHQTRYHLDSVLAAGEHLQLLDAANLSAGGKPHEYTDTLHPEWAALCVRLSQQMHLPFVGIDFMCADLHDPAADYVIIEVNAAPSLLHYASIGEVQASRVEALYQAIYNTPPP